MTIVRHRQVCRRFTPKFTPFVGAPFFVNSKWCGIDVVRPAYVGELSYDRSWIDRQTTTFIIPLLTKWPPVSPRHTTRHCRPRPTMSVAILTLFCRPSGRVPGVPTLLTDTVVAKMTTDGSCVAGLTLGCYSGGWLKTFRQWWIPPSAVVAFLRFCRRLIFKYVNNCFTLPSNSSCCCHLLSLCVLSTSAAFDRPLCTFLWAKWINDWLVDLLTYLLKQYIKFAFCICFINRL